MQTILLLFTLTWNSGYSFGYDGVLDEDHYFYITTPEVDYGIVVSDDKIYCDTIFYKNS